MEKIVVMDISYNGNHDVVIAKRLDGSQGCFPRVIRVSTTKVQPQYVTAPDPLCQEGHAINKTLGEGQGASIKYKGYLFASS